MSLKLAEDKARHRLDEALRIANSDRLVPEKWEAITEELSGSTSKTFIAGLGIAMLAKATNKEVDPLAIKEEPHLPGSYSMRTLAEKVFVPVAHGQPVLPGQEYPAFHLGVTGPQPMNNQPYFRYSHLDEVDRHGAGRWLDVLKDALRKLKQLNEQQAVLALAAFIRCRTKVQMEHEREIEKTIGSVGDSMLLLDLLGAFVDQESTATDVPLRLQAVVGGLVKASGASVSSQGLYDPSRHAPGDVHVPDPEEPWWVSEVKARPLLHHEAQTFIEKVSEYGGIEGALIVAIHPDHQPLHRDELSSSARERSLLLCVCESMLELLAFIVAHPSAGRPAVERVSEAISAQLKAMDASAETLEEWRKLFDSRD